MKLITIVLLTIFLTGCGVYNLTNFTIPNDNEFVAVIESLDTPKKICQYMHDNFEHKVTIFACYDPYIMWLLNTKAGDCNDYATWAMFVAHYHGYEVYMAIVYSGSIYSHALAIFVENGKYNYSSNDVYCPVQVNTFKEIIDCHAKSWNIKVKSYKIYDYNMNLVKYEKK